MGTRGTRARLTISFPASVLKTADRLARKERRTKSEIFRVAFLQYQKRADEWEELFQFGERMAKEQGITTDEQIVELIKEMRREEAQATR